MVNALSDALRLDGITAEFKEVQAAIDFFQIENGFPNVDNGRLRLGENDGGFCFDAFVRVCYKRLQKRFTVEFSVRRKWHFVQVYKSVWHHVSRQKLRQLFLENILVRLLASVKCDDMLARVQKNDGRVDLIQRIHTLFDFAEFNAVAANFDLVVLAAKEDYVTVCGKTPKVACLVNATKSRMVDECGLCLFFTVSVALCNAHTADIDFTLDFGWANFKRFIQNINRLVCKRVSVRDALPTRIYVYNREINGPNGSFGCAAQTVDLGFREMFVNPCGERNGNPVAAHEDVFQFTIDVEFIEAIDEKLHASRH